MIIIFIINHQNYYAMYNIILNIFLFESYHNISISGWSSNNVTCKKIVLNISRTFLNQEKINIDISGSFYVVTMSKLQTTTHTSLTITKIIAERSNGRGRYPNKKKEENYCFCLNYEPKTTKIIYRPGKEVTQAYVVKCIHAHIDKYTPKCVFTTITTFAFMNSSLFTV